MLHEQYIHLAIVSAYWFLPLKIRITTAEIDSTHEGQLKELVRVLNFDGEII